MELTDWIVALAVALIAIAFFAVVHRPHGRRKIARGVLPACARWRLRRYRYGWHCC